MNKNYRLQLRSHKEIFPSRENAINYINENFKADSLFAEPVVAAYGDGLSPKMILAVGLGNGKIAMIDMTNTEENVTNLINDNTLNKEDIAALKERVTEIVSASGLDFNDNLISGKISYKPKDSLVAQAKSISEAIELLCAEIKKNKSDFNLTVEDSETINFELKRLPSGDTKVLTGSINLSNDNSIVYSGVNGGIKANIDVTCSEDDAKNNRLKVKIGDLVKDIELPGFKFIKDVKYYPRNKAIRVNANDGTHLDIDVSDMVQTWVVDAANNNGPVVIHRTEDLGNPDKVYAELKLSPSDNFIEKDVSGNISVSQTKVSELAVRKAKEEDAKLDAKIKLELDKKALQTDLDKEVNKTNLIDNKLTTAISDINNIKLDIKSGKITAGETSTVANRLDGNKILSDVKLSNTNDNILKSLSNGLYAKAKLSYNSDKNILTFDNGICPVDITLRDKNNIDTVEYEAETKDLVFTFSDGCDTLNKRVVRVPLCDLYNNFDVLCDRENPVVLTKQITECGKDILSATINLSDNLDNLIEIVDGALFASNMADKHYTIWSDGGACGVDTKITVQEALNRLKTKIENADFTKEDLDGLKALINQVDKKADNIRIDLGNKTDIADANGSAFGRIENVKERISETNLKIDNVEIRLNDRITQTENNLNGRIDNVEASIGDKIKELDKADSPVNGKYVSAVSQTDGIITVTRENLPVTGAEDTEKVISVSNSKLKTTLSLSVDEGPQADGERYLRLKGINGQLIDKVSLDFTTIKDIDCGEY